MPADCPLRIRPYFFFFLALELAACGDDQDPTQPDASTQDDGSSAAAGGASGASASTITTGSMAAGSGGTGGMKPDAQPPSDGPSSGGSGGQDGDATPDGALAQDVAPDVAPGPDGSEAPDGAPETDAATAAEGATELDASDDATPETAATVDAQDACGTSAPAFNLATDGTATSSDLGDDGPGSVEKVFDDHSGTKWLVSANATPWIAYEFPGTDAHVVTTYTVTSANDGVTGNVNRDPADWQLQGSNDGPNASGIDWTTLDTRTAETFTSRYQTRTFSFSNATAYHRYRFLVTANGGAPAFQISELQLFGPGAPVFSVDDTAIGSGDNQFSFSSGWVDHTYDVTSARYDGSSSWCRLTNAFVTFTFIGTQVRLYGVKDVAHGIIAIWVDDGPETKVDLYGPLAYNQLIYTQSMPCAGRHQLKARVTGERNPAAIDDMVSVDRAQVVP